MSVAGLIQDLRKVGVRLWADGDRLRFEGPEGAITSDLLARLKAEKNRVLHFLESVTKVEVPDLGEIIEVPRKPSSTLPLSFAQQRLWFLEQMEVQEGAYNVAADLRLRGKLSIPAIQRSLYEILKRHEALRTAFPARDGQSFQSISPPAEPNPCMADLSGLPEKRRAKEASRLFERGARLRFKIARPGLIRFLITRLGPENHRLLVCMHHIVSDGWSLGILVREFGEAYKAFALGSGLSRPPLPFQYADFAYWERNILSTRVFPRQLRYWKNRLQDVAEQMNLPIDRPRGPVRSLDGSRYSFQLDARLVSSIHKIGTRAGATPFMTFLAAFSVLLGRYCGTADVVIGSPVANRGWRGLESLIGFFCQHIGLPQRSLWRPGLP